MSIVSEYVENGLDIDGAMGSMENYFVCKKFIYRKDEKVKVFVFSIYAVSTDVYCFPCDNPYKK